jgi:hypothetical protein
MSRMKVPPGPEVFGRTEATSNAGLLGGVGS